MDGMRHQLEEKYNNLFRKYNLELPLENREINHIIRLSLHDFLKNSERPAIYCNGGHTRTLMADFIYELKKVKYIVDNYASGKEEAGYILIKDHEIESAKIDAIILSTFKFRKDVKKSLAENHPNIPVLDIYDEFEKNDIYLQSDYYYSNHPYHNYHSINNLQREIKKAEDEERLEELYLKLITKYIQIKDFRTALIKVQEMKDFFVHRNDDADKKQSVCGFIHFNIPVLQKDLEEIYELEKQAASFVSKNIVLMLCLDALRYRDLSERDMPKLKKILDRTAYSFGRAYSFSTSTFESLVPVYSENGDLRTKYYERNAVDAKECRFARLAEQQRRKIYIYGDVEHFIEGKGICYSDSAQTVTEKIWDFLMDSSENEDGLFYVHEQYESHFTFSNPYTSEPLKSEGTAMLFDFLPMKGGHLRADYERQHQDAIHYLDDVLAPFLEKLSCRMVFYADHGTLILNRDAEISEIGDTEYTCSEGWTRIPLIIRSPETGVGRSGELISLMELGSIIVSLLNREDYVATVFRKKGHIKIARSELYNPDFRFLYGLIGKERYLEAFECFVFEDGYKLIIFADGYTELYLLQGEKDIAVCDVTKRKELFGKIKDEITVCDAEVLKI